MKLEQLNRKTETVTITVNKDELNMLVSGLTRLIVESNDAHECTDQINLEKTLRVIKDLTINGEISDSTIDLLCD